MADEQFFMDLQMANAGPCPENVEKASPRTGCLISIIKGKRHEIYLLEPFYVIPLNYLG